MLGWAAARAVGAARRDRPDDRAAAYLAPEGLEATLAEELAPRRRARSPPGTAGWRCRPTRRCAAAWALDIWTAPREIAAPSVKAAADALRAMQRNWAAYAAAHHRRMALIAARLPPVKARSLLRFPSRRPPRISAPGRCWRPTGCWPAPPRPARFVNGECRFEEDRTGPPSRAYLKLWEALHAARRLAAAGRDLHRPRRRARRLDLGDRAARRRGARRWTRRRSTRAWPPCRA